MVPLTVRVQSIQNTLMLIFTVSILHRTTCEVSPGDRYPLTSSVFHRVPGPSPKLCYKRELLDWNYSFYLFLAVLLITKMSQNKGKVS